MDRPESIETEGAAVVVGAAGASAATTIEKLNDNNKPNAKRKAFIPIFIIETV